MPANLENSTVATGLENVSFHSIPKKGNAKECSDYRAIALISHASKVMLKILQARLQQYVNRELPDVVFLYFFALIAEEDFLISPCYSLELCIQMLISFLFSFAFHFSSQLFVRPLQTVMLLFWISFPWAWS